MGGNSWAFCIYHMVPRGREFVVAAWLVNYMKSDLTVDELWAVIGELDRCWREGGEFDRGIAGFRYWRGGQSDGRRG